ncbi:putative ABC transporter permease protein [Phaeobacter piscinae]|nr:putative ABC transporter permease protein [Phaeobacter piscinae]
MPWPLFCRVSALSLGTSGAHRPVSSWDIPRRGLAGLLGTFTWFSSVSWDGSPSARRTIMVGVNQTILLSLAMVVVASLIGAKGLGEDVLEALQYSAAGQGILAGLAILFCALILDRIVAGRR